MRNRKLLAALAVGIALAVYLSVPTPSRVSREYFDRINVGMRRALVESFLGMPGDYRTGPTEEPAVLPFDPDAGEQPGASYWAGDAGIVTVEYDDDDKVKEKHFEPVRRAAPSLFDDWLWRVRRQWRRWFH
jgi:hypothetical protein